jgi:hypothetical protein
VALAGACSQPSGIAASARAQLGVPWITTGWGERDSTGMDAGVLAGSR